MQLVRIVDNIGLHSCNTPNPSEKKPLFYLSEN